MNATEAKRRDRLHQLVDLVRESNGWSRAQVARALDRDPTKVYPNTGNPKADFLMRLATVLGWPVGQVMENIWGGSEAVGVSPDIRPEAPENPADIEHVRDAYDKSVAHHGVGQYRQAVTCALRMYELAQNANQRATACALEAVSWDGLGHHQRSAQACRRGLAIPGVSLDVRNNLRGNLGNAWYVLWDLTPALGTAESIIDHYRVNPPEDPKRLKTVAYAHYVRGNTRRRMIVQEPELMHQHAQLALTDLLTAHELHLELANKLDNPRLEAVGHTALGGAIECKAVLGELSSEDALDHVTSVVNAGMSSEPFTTGSLKADWVESFGWWCIFGVNIALRDPNFQDFAPVDHLLQRSLETAERLDNWAMRERAYTLQHSLHLHSNRSEIGSTIEFPFSERQAIAGAIGRFPSFRQVGWDLLNTATFVEGGKEARS